MPPGCLGQTLKRHRRARGWTQAQLATRVHVSAPYIVMIERGTRRTPSLRFLQRVAKALDVSLGELLGLGLDARRSPSKESP